MLRESGASSNHGRRWLLDRPLARTNLCDRWYCLATTGQEIGSSVDDLIFSIAKREVTFFSGTAAISRL